MLSIVPTLVDALNIERAVLTLNGKQIEPLESTLAQMEGTSKLGGKVILGGGVIWFPQDAIQPGAVITLIPKTGRNVTHTFTAAQLKDIK